MLATMTALRKADGGVRGIATGTVFRRLVAKCLSRQYVKEVEKDCAPYQFAMSTRAGTDCVGHAIRAITDYDPNRTVLSIDGVGAYDHVLRSAMLSKLHEVESLRGLLPFVRSAYSRPSVYHWQEDGGQWRQIRQSEGGEQGDPLMPLLFCLAVHDAFVEVQEHLQAGEEIFAYLDDVYALSTPERSRDLYDLLAQKLHDVAGIRLHTGKTRTWNRAGAVPERMAELGPSVWSPAGLKILGTPLGTPEFHSIATRERLEEETLLWRAIPWVPNLQCSWQLLVQCAGPRCHHFLRCVPPELSITYAEEHDRGMMEVMGTLLEGLPGDLQQQHEAAQLATLPMRMGGLGLCSASRMAPSAYWASWADSFPMIQDRLPGIADMVARQLESEEPVGCLASLQHASEVLDRSGFVGRPTWESLRGGSRPPPNTVAEPGEWQHGWQCYASSSLEHHFRDARGGVEGSGIPKHHQNSTRRHQRAYVTKEIQDKQN